MEDKILDYCKNKYNIIFNETYKELIAKAKTRSGNIPDSKMEEFEKTAQLEAIKVTMVEGRKLYPNNIPLLWASIYKTHLYRKSGISDPDVIAKAIQAEQSWRASSGHAFEAMVKELGTLALAGTNIRYVLQKDLNILLKTKELANQPTDIAWLKNQVKGSVFDLYVVADTKVINEENNEVEVRPKCFGCVQCKTSIRDRVSRDIVPSREAMASNFWSIGFVLDGTMFEVPKYKNMVNGNQDSEFKKNGWHGMYVLSFKDNIDRIYGVDLDFKIIREHTIKAFNCWHSDRMGLVQEWRADNQKKHINKIKA